MTEQRLVSVGDANCIIRSFVRERVQNGLNGILQGISEMTSKLSDPSKAKLALLYMVEEAIGEIMEVQKRRVSP